MDLLKKKDDACRGDFNHACRQAFADILGKSLVEVRATINIVTLPDDAPEWAAIPVGLTFPIDEKRAMRRRVCFELMALGFPIVATRVREIMVKFLTYGCRDMEEFVAAFKTVADLAAVNFPTLSMTPALKMVALVSQNEKHKAEIRSKCKDQPVKAIDVQLNLNQLNITEMSESSKPTKESIRVFGLAQEKKGVDFPFQDIRLTPWTMPRAEDFDEAIRDRLAEFGGQTLQDSYKSLLVHQDAELKKSHQPVLPFIGAVTKLLLSAAICDALPKNGIFRLITMYTATLTDIGTKFGTVTAKDYDEKLRRRIAQGSFEGRDLANRFRVRQREVLDDIVTERRLAVPAKPKAPATPEPAAKRQKIEYPPQNKAASPQFPPKGKGKRTKKGAFAGKSDWGSGKGDWG